ncbi:MAG: SDR family oxidoreductase [Salibacteraceae bacterium]
MKNAIITGSSKGLGRAIAEKLSAEGYRVWLTARNASALKAAKEAIEAKTGSPVEIDTIDLADHDQTTRYAKSILERCEHVDVLVNNAGIFVPDQLHRGKTTLTSQMNLNFYAAHTITQALMQKFMDQKSGHIFNICSAVTRKPRAEAASYTISKFALLGYHKVLHQTLLPLNIKVTAFFPGSINTSSWDGMNVPRNEFIQPEDIAEMLSGILKLKSGTVPSEIDLTAINPDY